MVLLSWCHHPARLWGCLCQVSDYRTYIYCNGILKACFVFNINIKIQLFCFYNALQTFNVLYYLLTFLSYLKDESTVNTVLSNQPHFCFILQNLSVCPEDESIIMSSFVNTMTSLSVKQGKTLLNGRSGEIPGRVVIFAVALAVLIVVQLLIIKVTKILSVICVFQWRMEKCLTSEAWDWIGSDCRYIHNFRA